MYDVMILLPRKTQWKSSKNTVTLGFYWFLNPKQKPNDFYCSKNPGFYWIIVFNILVNNRWCRVVCHTYSIIMYTACMLKVNTTNNLYDFDSNVPIKYNYQYIHSITTSPMHPHSPHIGIWNSYPTIRTD